MRLEGQKEALWLVRYHGEWARQPVWAGANGNGPPWVKLPLESNETPDFVTGEDIDWNATIQYVVVEVTPIKQMQWGSPVVVGAQLKMSDRDAELLRAWPIYQQENRNG